MKINKLAPFILLLVLAIISLSIQKGCRLATENETKEKTETRGFNRNPAQIHYSKHARCRMDCRHIDEREILDLLHNGKINYKKSELLGDDCHKKYALEGISKDGQHLRIIVAPCADEETIVTCIDLDTEWSCDCE